MKEKNGKKRKQCVEVIEISEKEFDDGLIDRIRRYESQIELMENQRQRCIRILLDKERDKGYSDFNLSYHRKGNSLLYKIRQSEQIGF